MPAELDIRGVFLGSSTPDELAANHEALRRSMELGLLTPVVGMRLTLAEAATSHVEVMAPSAGGACGNIVIAIG